MTQIDAVINALKELGGRAQLKEIYPLAMGMAHFGGKTPKNTIRNYLLRNPKVFRSSPDKPDGWWELISFQEEISRRDQLISKLEKEIETLRKIPTEDDFVRRLVKESKKLYKHEKDKVKVIRQILYNLGCIEAEAELDAWIDGKEYKTSVNVAGNMYVQGNLNNVHDNKTVNF